MTSQPNTPHRRILVIEDNHELLGLLRMASSSAAIAPDAKAGLEILASGGIGKVMCDFHGIQKDGKTAHDVVKFCLEHKIPCFMTTSDPIKQVEFLDTYGVMCVSKFEAVVAARKS